MKKRLASTLLAALVIILFGSVPGGVADELLPPEDITYLGSFSVPSNLSWSNLGGDIQPCPGGDPSPGDGYPDCMAVYGQPGASLQRAEQHVYWYDLVPPGGAARIVAGPVYYGQGNEYIHAGVNESSQFYDILRDDTGGECVMWHTYGTWYLNIQSDPPWLMATTCDTKNPRFIGMYDTGPEFLGDIQLDPFHTAKAYRWISLLDEEQAQLFNGHRLMWTGPFPGPRGGSDGPTVYTRPNTIPSGPRMLDASDWLWYVYRGGYLRWDETPDMVGGAARWWTDAKPNGAELIGGDEEGWAVVIPYAVPEVVEGEYPCTAEGKAKYADSKYPDPCEYPLIWYGIQHCNQTSESIQQPRFWKYDANGDLMPIDCKIKDPVSQHAGPHAPHRRTYLIGYSVEDLTTLAHNESQPRFAIDLTSIGIGGVSDKHGGTAYDRARRRLYLLTATHGQHAAHVFKIGEGGTTPPLPPPCGTGCRDEQGRCIECPPPATISLVAVPAWRVDSPIGVEVAVLVGFDDEPSMWEGCEVGISRDGEKPYFRGMFESGEVATLVHAPDRDLFVQSVDPATCTVSEVAEVPR